MDLREQRDGSVAELHASTLQMSLTHGCFIQSAGRIGPLSAICLLTADNVQLDQLINQVKLLNLVAGSDYATVEDDYATNVLNDAAIDEHLAEK
ncbi:hypothetical protein Ancab_012884 [Ancistrocladus abbreviatus]